MKIVIFSFILMLLICFVFTDLGYYIIAKGNWHRVYATGEHEKEKLVTCCVNPAKKTLVIYPKGKELWRRTYHHEMMHLRQIEDEGRFFFTVKYLAFLARYGYEKNPFEVEARNYGVNTALIELKYYTGKKYRGYDLELYMQYIAKLNLSEGNRSWKGYRSWK